MGKPLRRILVPVRDGFDDGPDPKTHQASGYLLGLYDNGAGYRFEGGETVCDYMHSMLILAPKKSGKRTWERCTHIAAMLAFIHDLPVVPQVDMRGRRRKGPGFDLGKYLELLEATSEVCGEFYLHGFWQLDDYRAYRVREPKQDALWRSLLAYWAALLSPALPSRMINFFRAVEALGYGKAPQQEKLLKDLPSEKLRPVWAGRWGKNMRRTNDAGKPLRTDRARLLRKRALAHLSDLVSQHGSEAKVRWHLWDTRRGKAAHADIASAEYDYLTTLSDQAADVELMHFAARVAIERAWP